MPISYSRARGVELVARDVIRDHHPHLLANEVYVKFLFTDEAEKVKGKRVSGTARKVTGLAAYLDQQQEDEPAKEFFLICIWQQYWTSRRTTDEQRRALVDHELCHCFSEAEEDEAGNRTGKIKLSTLPHDLEEFNCIVERYGAWHEEIDDFIKSYHGETEAQPGLFDEEPPQPSASRDAESKGTTITLTHKGGSVTTTAEQMQRRYEELEARANARKAKA